MPRRRKKARKSVPAKSVSPRIKNLLRITFGKVTFVVSIQKRKRKKEKIHKQRWTASFLIFIFAISLFVGGNIVNPNLFKIQQKNLEPSTQPELSWPTKIVISKINLAVPVAPGGIINGDWILSYDWAQYLPTSGKPGEGFNTIIYAHRLPNLFANLNELSPGDRIEVIDGGGHTFFYKVYATESIDPKETIKLFSPVPNNLTLFTCDGWWDQKRLVVKAKMAIWEDPTEKLVH